MTCAHALARAVAAHGRLMHFIFVHVILVTAWQRCGAQFNAAARCRIAVNFARGCMCRLRSLAECSGSAPTCRVQKRVAALWCCVRRRIRWLTRRVSFRAVCVCVCVIWFCTAVPTRGLIISDIGCHVAAALGLHVFGQSNPCVMAWQSDGNATSSAAAEGKVWPISGIEKWSVFGKVRPDSGHKNEASFTNNLNKIYKHP